MNEAVRAAAGYAPEEYYADPGLIFRIVHPDDRALMETILHGGHPSGSTAGIRCIHRNGSLVWLEQRAMHVRDDGGRLIAIEAIARDVTDRKLLEERLREGTLALRQSLAEKTALLQEVHHRVNNNLQLICSLLSMQIQCAGSDSFSAPLSAAHSRVLSMSLIHEQIYRSEALADLNFGEYIEVLAERLFSIRCTDRARIRLELSVDPVRLSVDQAIPCGLILNELISNALRHGFRDDREGTVRISLRQAEGRYTEITVADDGAGLPADFQPERSQSLGMQVVRTLIRQLGADFSVTGEPGATFRFGWKPQG